MTEPEDGKKNGSNKEVEEAPVVSSDMDIEEDVASSKVEEKSDNTDGAEEKKGDDGDKMEDSKAKSDSATAEAEEKPKKKKYTDWPLKDIKEPHENDVLYGRGGGTNHHPGNKRYRKMVEDRKLDYVNSKRLDKPLVALDIIRTWRDQDPPGRFLKLDEKKGLWVDVGDKKAREKTSQALREKAPEIRKKQEEEEMIKQGKDPSKVREKEKAAKLAAEASKDKQKGKVNHAVLARDHTLGTEYLSSREAITLDGFTWDPTMLDRVSSYGSVGGNAYPPGRGVSHGSHGVPPPYFPPSRAGSHSSHVPPPVPPPGAEYYDERQRSFARYDSWARMQSGGSVGSHMPPPPPPPMSPHSPYGGGSPFMPRGGSYGGPPPMSREHSLSNNPLRDASIGQPANPSAFARGSSGYWDPHMPPPPPAPSSLPPSPAFGGPRYDSYGRPPSGVYDPHAPPPPPPAHAHSPPPPNGAYRVDPSIAQSWSSQSEDFEKAASVLAKDEWSDGEEAPSRPKVRPGTTFPEQSSVPRPDIVKRMTSNQNEDTETRPGVQDDGRSIRRAPLNRNKSEASNRLKAQYAPGAISRPMPLDHDMRMLSNSMAESSLDTKPKPLTADERKSTMENITMDLMAKPTPLTAGTRSSTIEALGIDLDVNVDDSAPPIPKPPALRTEGRMTTAEYNDLVNEPLGLDQEVGKPMDLNREASVSEWLSQG